MSDAELERFKTEIDLRAYTAMQGYVWDQRESWSGSSVMRHQATDDKIIIKRDGDGHYVFFSVRDNASGSIIDFIQRRQGGSLGAVRKQLRPWLGLDTRAGPGQPAAVLTFPALSVTGKDRIRVETELVRIPPSTNWSGFRPPPVTPTSSSKENFPPASLIIPGFAAASGATSAATPSFLISTGRAFAATKSRTAVSPVLPRAEAKASGSVTPNPTTAA